MVSIGPEYTHESVPIMYCQHRVCLILSKSGGRFLMRETHLEAVTKHMTTVLKIATKGIPRSTTAATTLPYRFCTSPLKASQEVFALRFFMQRSFMRDCKAAVDSKCRHRV